MKTRQPNFKEDVKLFTFQIETLMYDTLVAVAKDDERSVAYHVRQAVINYVEGRTYNHGVQDCSDWISECTAIKGKAQIDGKEFREFIADEMKEALES